MLSNCCITCVVNNRNDTEYWQVSQECVSVQNLLLSLLLFFGFLLRFLVYVFLFFFSWFLSSFIYFYIYLFNVLNSPVTHFLLSPFHTSFIVFHYTLLSASSSSSFIPSHRLPLQHTHKKHVTCRFSAVIIVSSERPPCRWCRERRFRDLWTSCVSVSVSSSEEDWLFLTWHFFFCQNPMQSKAENWNTWNHMQKRTLLHWISSSLYQTQ